jgi:hypothetical protein
VPLRIAPSGWTGDARFPGDRTPFRGLRAPAIPPFGARRVGPELVRRSQGLLLVVGGRAGCGVRGSTGVLLPSWPIRRERPLAGRSPSPSVPSFPFGPGGRSPNDLSSAGCLPSSQPTCSPAVARGARPHAYARRPFVDGGRLEMKLRLVGLRCCPPWPSVPRGSAWTRPSRTLISGARILLGMVARPS